MPGWVQSEVTPGGLYSFSDAKDTGFTVSVNGEKVDVQPGIDGYLTLERKWKSGDEVLLQMDMIPRLVKADDRVEADRGRVAVEKGPIVYCAEQVDNTIPVLEAVLDPAAPLVVSHDDALCGIDRIQSGELNLIPYYAWNHRGKGDMIVWLLTL